jgi:hypothetical protein
MTIERTIANTPSAAASAAASAVASKGKDTLIALDQGVSPPPQKVSRPRRPATDANTPMPTRSALQGTTRSQRTSPPRQEATGTPQQTRTVRPTRDSSDSFRPSDRKDPPTVTYDKSAAQAKTPPTSLDDASDPRATAAGSSQAPAVSAKQMLASFDKLLQQVLGKDFKQPTNHAERTQLAGLAMKRLKGAAREQFLAKAESLGRDFGLNFGLSRASAKGSQPLNAGTAGRLDAERSAAYSGLANEWRAGNGKTGAPSGLPATPVERGGGATQQPSPSLIAPTAPDEPTAANRDVAMLQQGADSTMPTSAQAAAEQTSAEPDGSHSEVAAPSGAA